MCQASRGSEQVGQGFVAQTTDSTAGPDGKGRQAGAQKTVSLTILRV